MLKNKKLNLKIKYQIGSVYSPLTVEANLLSLQSIENIVDNKIALRDRKEIKEVKNASIFLCLMLKCINNILDETIQEN